LNRDHKASLKTQTNVIQKRVLSQIQETEKAGGTNARNNNMWQLILRKIAGEAAADMLDRAAFIITKKGLKKQSTLTSINALDRDAVRHASIGAMM